MTCFQTGLMKSVLCANHVNSVSSGSISQRSFRQLKCNQLLCSYWYKINGWNHIGILWLKPKNGRFKYNLRFQSCFSIMSHWICRDAFLSFCFYNLISCLSHLQRVVPFQIPISFMVLIILLQLLQISLHLQVRLSFAYGKFKVRENFNYGIVIFFYLYTLDTFLFWKNIRAVYFPVGVEKRHVFIRHTSPFFVQLKLSFTTQTHGFT